MTKKTGHCLCHRITYQYEGEENWIGHCHCESCRRNTSSAFTTFMGVPLNQFIWTNEQPAIYHSSKGVTRMFCPECGTPIAFHSEKYPDEIHLYVASLDDDSGMTPEFHTYFSEKVDWVELSDTLPRHTHDLDE